MTDDEKPRMYTQKEVQDMFLDHLEAMAHYCATMKADGFVRPGQTETRYRIDLFLHCVLCALDGVSMGLPAFEVVPSPHPSDEASRRDNGENWWPNVELPEGAITVHGGDMLHEVRGTRGAEP